MTHLRRYEKGKPMPQNILVHRQALAMHAAGATTNEIVRAIGVQRQTVNVWIKAAKDAAADS